MQYREDIQVLRGLAVLLVVLFHLQVPGFENGFLGVDIFFVISGFLMASIYQSGKLWQFYTRRARRLLPAYLFVVFATMIVGLFVLEWGEFKQLQQQAIYALFFVSNIGFWLHNSYFSNQDFIPLLHLWSLGVELQFYVVAPLLFFLSARFKWLYVFVFISSLVACLCAVTVWPETAFFMMPFRVWEFAAGCFVASQLTKNGVPQRSSQYKRWADGLFLAVLLLMLVPIDASAKSILVGHPGFWAIVSVLLASCVLWRGLSADVVESLPGRMLAFLGDLSYSIYLIHFPLMALYLYQPFKAVQSFAPSWIDTSVLLALTIIISWGMKKLIEDQGKAIFSVRRCAAAMTFSIVTCAILLPVKSSMYSDFEFNVRNSIFDRGEFRCGKFYSLLHRGDELCKLNDLKSNKKVLLLGNSHADSIKKSFMDVATDQEYELWFVVQNEALLGQPGSLDVGDVVSAAIKYGINHVVLHYSPHSISMNIVSKLQKELHKRGILFAYISPVPTWGTNVPQMLISELKQGKYREAQSYQKYLDANKEVFQHFSHKYEGDAVFLDVGIKLCQPECDMVSRAGDAYYFDRGHMTLSGGRQLIPIFQDLFEKWE
ncbi:acyltransferase [Thalassospira sp. MA62]|nr:acyltransferase [Thalassospira sp. MA62]